MGVVPELRPDQATELPKAYGTHTARAAGVRLLTLHSTVVLENPKEATLAKAVELIDWLADRTAHYKKVRGGIVFIEAIPKKWVYSYSLC